MIRKGICKKLVDLVVRERVTFGINREVVRSVEIGLHKGENKSYIMSIR